MGPQFVPEPELQRHCSRALLAARIVQTIVARPSQPISAGAQEALERGSQLLLLDEEPVVPVIRPHHHELAPR